MLLNLVHSIIAHAPAVRRYYPSHHTILTSPVGGFARDNKTAENHLARSDPPPTGPLLNSSVLHILNKQQVDCTYSVPHPTLPLK